MNDLKDHVYIIYFLCSWEDFFVGPNFDFFIQVGVTVQYENLHILRKVD